MADEPNSLLKALHAVQASAPTLTKDAEGQVGSRHYKYTPLDTIVEAIKPLLKANGLVWYAPPGGTHDAPTITYVLAHVETGEKIEGEMPLMIGENPTSQALGSAITYARRYALTAVLNLVADEDDDGKAATGYGRTAQRPAQGSTVISGRPMASEAQIKLIKRLAKQKNVTPEQAGLIREQLGMPFGLTLEEMTGGKDGQASALITFLKENPIPTGESDVPSDTSEFENPDPIDEQDQLPVTGAPE